jgi:hypothetical protein
MRFNDYEAKRLADCRTVIEVRTAKLAQLTAEFATEDERLKAGQLRVSEELAALERAQLEEVLVVAELGKTIAQINEDAVVAVKAIEQHRATLVADLEARQAASRTVVDQREQLVQKACRALEMVTCERRLTAGNFNDNEARLRGGKYREALRFIAEHEAKPAAPPVAEGDRP